MTDQLDATAVDTAADLGRRLADASKARMVSIEQGAHAPFVVPLRHDEVLREFDPEKYLEQPHRTRGHADLHDPVSFAAYVTRLIPDSDRTATLWADDQQRAIIAVFNDHADTMTPGWRDHTAKLKVRVDPDWETWTSNNGKLKGQLDFGEFLEQQLHTIVDPPAADLVSVATQFKAKRNVTFDQSTRLQSGEVQFEYREETTTSKGKGQIEVPERFTIKAAPFIGAEPVQMVARLLYRIGPEGLRIGYVLTRPDIAEKRAFDAIVTKVGENVPEGIAVLFGTAPASLR